MKKEKLGKALSPELNLILFLTGDIYKETDVLLRENPDWSVFVRMAYRNKVLYHSLRNLKKLGLANTDMPCYMDQLEAFGDRQYTKLSRTLEAVNAVLGKEAYLLLKTYRTYPYITHDIDVLVENLRWAKELFEKEGFMLLPNLDKHKLSLVQKGFLEIELHEDVCWGSLRFVDKEVLWSNIREKEVADVKTCVPGVEGDILTYLAHMNFQQYQILLGDLLYVYTLLSKADWKLIERQATKHQWLLPFRDTVAILNGLHSELYGEPGPIHDCLPLCAKVHVNFPFMLPLTHVTRALITKGTVNVAKLASYYSARLEDVHSVLHEAYGKIVMDCLGSSFVRYVYY